MDYLEQYRNYEEADEAFNFSFMMVKQRSFIRQMDMRMLKVQILHAEIAETQRLINESINIL